MRFQFDEKKKILISLQPLEFSFIYREKFRNIFIYLIDDADLFLKRSFSQNAIRYLDCFVILLPQEYEKQRSLWEDFYIRFGNQYESLINTANNLECIEMLFDLITDEIELSDSSNILDYGCGSGISMNSKFKGRLYGYEFVPEMRIQAENKGMNVFCGNDIGEIPDDFFDVVFSSYVFHMGISELDIRAIIPKMKENSIWVANFYKNLNTDVVSEMFKKYGFTAEQIANGRFGNVYQYRKYEIR